MTDIEKTKDDEEEPTITVVTGKEGVGMTYLAHDLVSSSICHRCGRTLTAPRSVACQFGPTCYMILFGKPQPRAPGEISKVSRGSGKISKIDLSELIDLREFFE